MANLSNRLAGPENVDKLADALSAQPTLKGNAKAIQQIAEEGSVLVFTDGELLLTEKHDDDDMFFVVSGKVEVLIKGNRVAFRHAPSVVGEVACLHPNQPRMASVRAVGDVTVVRVARTLLNKIDPVPSASLRWELAILSLSRLLERNKHFLRRNDSPRIFLASARESIEHVKQFETELAKQGFDVRPWYHEGVFPPGRFPWESLESCVKACDFAIIFSAGEDLLEMRGERSPVPRGNLLVEAGLCMGALGRERTYQVQLFCESGSPVWPSDFSGLAPLPATTPEEILRSLSELSARIKQLGPRERLEYERARD